MADSYEEETNLPVSNPVVKNLKICLTLLGIPPQ